MAYINDILNSYKPSKPSSRRSSKGKPKRRSSKGKPSKRKMSGGRRRKSKRTKSKRK